MEFLVEFEIAVPDGTPRAEADARQREEAVSAAELARRGRLIRVWRPPAGPGEVKALGLYRADSRAQLDELLAALPLAGWMCIAVTALDPHPNDPLEERPAGFALPEPRMTPVFRLEASLGQPLDLGDTAQGRRRIVPLTEGAFSGREIGGTLVAGASADWQTVLPDGTALGDIRCTLRTDTGDLLDLRARGVRHGSAEVLTRLARGEAVDASEYTFRTAARIETGAPGLDWFNKGVFVCVGGRQPDGVVYETYLVE